MNEHDQIIENAKQIGRLEENIRICKIIKEEAKALLFKLEDADFDTIQKLKLEFDVLTQLMNKIMESK